MSKLKRDMKLAPISDKVVGGKELVIKCTGNPDIGTVSAALAAFEAANTGLETAQITADNARTAAEQLTTVQGNSNDTWDVKFETLLSLIEANTEGDRTKLETTGLETAASGRTPAGPPAQVTGVSVTQGDNPGELEVSWNGLRPNPRLYKVRMCASPYVQANMVDVGTPTGSRFVKSGLVSGQEYWFEVAAVGSGNQQGPWSGPENGRAD